MLPSNSPNQMLLRSVNVTYPFTVIIVIKLLDFMNEVELVMLTSSDDTLAAHASSSL